jgi:divalent metal cation (Fe/Co/Zn/Cd) transporter
MEQLLIWMEQNQALAIIIAVVSLFIFIVSLKSTTTKIFSSNRGVAIGRDNNSPIMTGDINSNRSGILDCFTNIATILALVVSTATLYITYLAFIKVG